MSEHESVRGCKDILPGLSAETLGEGRDTTGDGMIEQLPQGAVPEVAPEGIALSGVGRLAEIIGVQEAREFFEERESRQRFLYGRSLKRRGGS